MASLEGKSPEDIAALAALADGVLNNPKTAGTFKRLLKATDPSLSMPEIELEDRVGSVLKAQNDEIRKLQAAAAQRDAQDGATGLLNRLVSAGLVTGKSDFEDLVKYATENGFTTAETGLRRAAENRNYERESAEPTPVSVIGRGSVLPIGSADFLKDPSGTARAVAQQAMDEMRKARSGGRTH